MAVLFEGPRFLVVSRSPSNFTGHLPRTPPASRKWPEIVSASSREQWGGRDRERPLESRRLSFLRWDLYSIVLGVLTVSSPSLRLSQLRDQVISFTFSTGLFFSSGESFAMLYLFLLTVPWPGQQFFKFQSMSAII